MSDENDQIDHYIQLPDIYDGWSIAVHHDGTHHNRWADSNGRPLPGYEHRYVATRQAIRAILGD